MSPFLPYSFWCCCLVTATCPSHFVFTRPEIKASQDGHRIDSRQKRAVTLAYARQRSERPLRHTPTRGSSRMCKPKSFDEIVQRPPDSVWCCEENSDTLVYHTNNGEGPKHAYDIRAAHANILIQKLTCGKSQMQNDPQRTRETHTIGKKGGGKGQGKTMRGADARGAIRGRR